MTMTITDQAMTSDDTPHHAVPTTPGEQYGPWRVSWLPDRAVSRDQAITALTLAEVVATRDLRQDGRWWPHVQSWAAELDLTGREAVSLVRQVPANTTTSTNLVKVGATPAATDLPAPVLAGRWSVAHWRIRQADRFGTDPQSADLLAELRLGTRLAGLVTAGRWALVARLLLEGGVDSWSQIAEATGLPASDAEMAFRVWLANEVHRHRTTGRGLSPAKAETLAKLIGVMSW